MIETTNINDIIANKNLINRFYLLAHMCNICYLNNDEIEDSHFLLQNIPKTRIFIQNLDTDVQCYIFYSANTTFICFRGTSTIRDACTDLKISQVEFINKNIKIHRGFHKQFESIKDEITKHIVDILNKNSKINTLCFLGHSLGAALATIASVWFKLIFKNITVECTTMGSPRVGNRYFVKMFKKNVDVSHRIVNIDDPIQYVPMNPFYHHVDNSYSIKNGIITIQKPVIGVMRIFNSFANLNYSSIIKPHRTATYIEYLKEILGK